MKVFFSTFGPVETNAYIVIDEKEAVLIDAPQNVLPWVKKILDQEQCTLKALWLTHSHWDHTADVTAVFEAFHPTVYIHSADAPNLDSPGVDGLPQYFVIPPFTTYQKVKDEDVLQVGQQTFVVYHTPGHSPGGVVFYNLQENACFTGDTLMDGTCGRVDFPGSDQPLMQKSLLMLRQLPPETILYPGHGEVTTLQKQGWLKHIKEEDLS